MLKRMVNLKPRLETSAQLTADLELSSPQKHVVPSRQDVASLIAPANTPLSKKTEATSADPIRATITTYSAAAPLWLSQKSARNLLVFIT